MKIFRSNRNQLLARALLSALLATLVTSCGTLQEPKTIALFDGKSLKGWQHILADPSVSRDQVWSVKDGILICKGEPLGALYKGPSVSDFQLEVDYRWAPGNKTPVNSGIFSRIQQPLKPLPCAVEVQLQPGKAGDVMGLHGKTIAGGQPRFMSIKGHPVAGDITGVTKLENAERPAGEWNNVVIEARGGTYTVHINGKLVNRAEGVDTAPGSVGVQSEGGEIHFRRIALTPLK